MCVTGLGASGALDKVRAYPMAHSRDQELSAVLGAMSARAVRRALFQSDLFADAAWDILLVLYAAALQEWTCDLEAVLAVGLSTRELLRRIDVLEGQGLVRTSSKLGPPTFRLSERGFTKMETFFATATNTSHV